MLWHLIIDANESDQLNASITVEAETWFAALREGLDKQGIDGKALANVSCHMAPDNSVYVTDFVTRRVYLLKPVDDTQKKQTTEVARSTTDAVKAPAPDEWPKYDVFHSRDEAPDDGSGIFYRERLIAVAPGLTKEAALALARHHFDMTRKLDAPDDTSLYVTIHIYDHAFTEHAERPAIVALTWKAWRPEEPEIFFPLSGDEGITFNTMPPPKRKKIKTKKDRDRETKTKTTANKDKTKNRSRISRGDPARELGLDDKMVEAFERMQEIYTLRDHDEAARFALSLARDLVPCEAGTSMLISPGKYELYIAAAEGPAAQDLIGRPLSLARGIVGFATKNSIVVNVTDPQSDSRFEGTLDRETGCTTNTVLCAPMQFEGATIGAIELINSTDEGGFTESEGHVLSYLSTNLAEYISTSLPSREADFTNREFLTLPSKRRTTKKKIKKKKIKMAAAKTKVKKPATKPKTASTKKPAESAKPKSKSTKKKSTKGKATGTAKKKTKIKKKKE